MQKARSRSDNQATLTAKVEAAFIEAPSSFPRLSSLLLPPGTSGTSLVAVVAAPLNPLDIAIESDVHTTGSWVYAQCHASPSSPSTFAAQVVVADQELLPLPEGLDPIVAAAVGNSGTAAFLPVVEGARLQPGETVLVLGATGAVGRSPSTLPDPAFPARRRASSG